MLDFDNDLDTAQSTRRVITRSTPVPQVEERVTVIPASDQRGFLAKPEAMWNWSDLRDYVVGEIEAAHGPQVRDPKKEAGIFKGFISRWGIEKAVAISRAAFQVHGGMWRNAPISVNRFCKGSDPYFAQPIADNLS
jgi:hypothetical protein